MTHSQARTDSLPSIEGTAHLCLLDGPYVVDNGRRFLVPEGSERLLVFVALRNGQAVSRRKVAGTLWPSVTEDRAAGNLRTALWRLRSSGIHILDAERHTLSVRVGTSIDVFTIDAWAGRLVDGSADHDDISIRHFHPAAIELLPGWYDDWIIFERERIRQKLLHALEILSERLAQEGRFGEAIEAAMTATEIDPLRESAQRTLILIHLSEGNFAQARHTYTAYSRLLESELGIAPAPELARLVHSVR
ncbi:BTAD domain-containing putative transcriptional regulator [Mycetocola sp. 2940]|uniref:AfsR/SARP family transcriptional regulator n=1 Tax=Mycetocola sp. 2940 TaxID=3156452 RepID=UPI003398D18E